MLTVYGIETTYGIHKYGKILEVSLQQYLPFTVLKLRLTCDTQLNISVATVLTVYGIETQNHRLLSCKLQRVATVLTVYDIETP